MGSLRKQAAFLFLEIIHYPRPNGIIRAGI